MRLACEATLNIAKRPEILEKMREAYFITIFCGIETPEPEALHAMHKDHNMMVPILEGVRTINSYGMEVVSGIIMGLDTDKPGTAAVGSSGAREPAQSRRKPRFQCRVPAALRRGHRVLPAMHVGCLRAGKGFLAL
jgi:hypothetical protein